MTHEGGLRLGPIIKLTRWREFVEFTAILTWLGGLLAYQVREKTLDWRLFTVLIANLSAVGYAFMINDIEDAEDDARDPERGKRNPVASGELSARTGWAAALTVAFVAAICYALAGTTVLPVGLVVLALAHCYSWRPVRLKARPLVDILSHGMFLSALLFMAAFLIYSDNFGYLWTIILGTFLISAYGQFYNQVRDYESDRAAGLQNTASVLGKQLMAWLSYASIAGFVLCFLAAILLGTFPLWLGPVLLATIPVVHFALRGNVTDMRGSETHDPVGLIQREFLIVINVLLLVWLAVAFIS